MNDLTPSEPDITDDEAAELLAFMDGDLPPERREAVERRIVEDPALAAAVERRYFAAEAIHAAVADTAAPHDLRLRIDVLSSRPSPARRRRRWLPLAGLAGATAVAAVAVVLAVGGPSLSVGDTVAAALRPPVAAVSVDLGQPALLRENVEQVQFPNFQRKFAWAPVGVRDDVIDGRATRTVFYERAGRRIAYTIVGGDALDRPGDSRRRRVVDGVELEVLRVGDRSVVTWRRQGHTCVLSGQGVGEGTLLELATWKGAGAVRF